MNIPCGTWRASLIMGVQVGTLEGQNCPKCASNQIVNDQCLKCGIVVSKYLNATQPSSQPVSYVAPSSQSHKEYSYSISKDHVEYEQRLKKYKRQRILVGFGILLGIALIAFMTWRLLMLNVASYAGMYKNGNLIYALYFPTEGPKWYHAEPNNLESLGIKDPHDSFYRGEDRDEPEISIAVYVGPSEFVPEKITAERQETLLADAEKSLLERMREQGVRCEIVDSALRNVGGRDGFIIEAEIDKDGKLYRTFVLNGYYHSRAYTVFFVGEDELMADNEELQTLMESFSFKTSVI